MTCSLPHGDTPGGLRRQVGLARDETSAKKLKGEKMVERKVAAYVLLEYMSSARIEIDRIDDALIAKFYRCRLRTTRAKPEIEEEEVQPTSWTPL